MLYFIKGSFGFVGFEYAEVVEAASDTEAEALARQLAIDCAESAGFYQDLEEFGNYDEVGCPCEEEDSGYSETGTLDYEAVPYNEEEHDGMY